MEKIKGKINSFLRKFDLEIHRPSHLRRDTMQEALRHLSRVGVTPSTIIDVGAAFGDWTESALNFFPNASYYGVEPQKKYYARLSKLPFKKIFECVLGGEPGKVTLYIHRDWYSSSVFIQTDDPYTVKEKRVVEQKTLDEIAANLPGPMLIKLDAEGAELNILKGGATTLAKTEALILEVLLIPFSPEIPRLEQVMDTLRDMGFLIYDIVDLVHRQTDGALRKIDLVFLRKENPLLHSNEILSPAEYEGYNSKFAHWNELRAKGKMK